MPSLSPDIVAADDALEHYAFSTPSDTRTIATQTDITAQNTLAVVSGNRVGLVETRTRHGRLWRRRTPQCTNWLRQPYAENDGGHHVTPARRLAYPSGDVDIPPGTSESHRAGQRRRCARRAPGDPTLRRGGGRGRASPLQDPLRAAGVAGGGHARVFVRPQHARRTEPRPGQVRRLPLPLPQ